MEYAAQYTRVVGVQELVCHVMFDVQDSSIDFPVGRTAVHIYNMPYITAYYGINIYTLYILYVVTTAKIHAVLDSSFESRYSNVQTHLLLALAPGRLWVLHNIVFNTKAIPDTQQVSTVT